MSDVEAAPLATEVIADKVAANGAAPRDTSGKFQRAPAPGMKASRQPTAAQEQARTAKEDYDKSVDEHLDKLVGGDEPEEEQENTPAERGAETPKPTKGDAPKDATPPDPKRTADLKAAREAIVLLGIHDEEDIAGMSEDQLLKLGRQAKTRNDEFNARLQRQSNDLKKPTAPAKPAPEPPAKTDAPTGDDYDRAAQGLSEAFGEELSRPVAESLRNVVSPMRQEIDSLKQTNEQLMVEVARGNLRERFPEIDQPEHESEFLKNVSMLREHGRTVRQSVEQAAIMQFGARRIQEGAERAQVLATKRDRGTANTSNRSIPVAAKSREDLLDDAIDVAMNGGDVQAVSRAQRGR